MEKGKLVGVLAALVIAAGSAFGQMVVDGHIISQQDQIRMQQQAVQNAQQQQGIRGLVYGPNGLCDQYRAQQQAEGNKEYHQIHGADTPLSLRSYGAAMNVICPPQQQQQQQQQQNQAQVQQQMQMQQQAQQTVNMINNMNANGGAFNQQQYNQMHIQQSQQNQNRP